MSRIKNTPPLNATGTFELLTPFTIEDGKVYRAEALDGFESLEVREIDVFKTYYDSQGLTQQDYEADKLNKVDIVTLMSDDAPTIYVPSSYIKSFPLTSGYPYGRIVLSVDLGVLPDGLDFLPVVSVIETQVSEIVGVLPENMEVIIHRLSETQGVDHSKHEQLENLRKSRISERVLPAVALVEALERVRSLEQRNAVLENLLIEELKT